MPGASRRDPAGVDRLEVGLRLAVRDRRERCLRELEVTRHLARGAHCSTYLAREAAAERWVVIKASHRGGEDTELAIEEQILRQLESPHLVSCLGGGADAKLHKVLAYERLYGNPLLLLSRKEVRAYFAADDPGGRYCPLPPRLALALSADLFRGLARLHAEGFVHHDVKLANLLVAVEGTAGRDLRPEEVLDAQSRGQARGVLVDFGAARSAAFLRELNAGDVDGSQVPPQLTPVYAPPEALIDQGDGRGRLLPSLDIYAAALVSYTLCCGRTPYEHLGVGAGDVQRLLKVKAQETRGAELPIHFEFLTRAPGMGELGAELFGFLSCCLSGDPRQRPSASEAAEHCDELVAWYGEGLAAGPAGATGTKAFARPGAAPSALASSEPAERWRERGVTGRRALPGRASAASRGGAARPDSEASTASPDRPALEPPRRRPETRVGAPETSSEDGVRAEPEGAGGPSEEGFATSAEAAVAAKPLREAGAKTEPSAGPTSAAGADPEPADPEPAEPEPADPEPARLATSSSAGPGSRRGRPGQGPDSRPARPGPPARSDPRPPTRRALRAPGAALEPQGRSPSDSPSAGPQRAAAADAAQSLGSGARRAVPPGSADGPRPAKRPERAGSGTRQVIPPELRISGSRRSPRPRPAEQEPQREAAGPTTPSEDDSQALAAPPESPSE